MNAPGTKLDHYRNPYDFVPLEGVPTYVDQPEAYTHAYVKGYSGVITFTLEVLTPLCIHQNPGEPEKNVYQFAHLGGTPTIPATSLKGMLRQVYEAVTNSTMGMLKTKERRDAWYHNAKYIPQAYLPNSKRDRLTSGEMLFGMVAGKGDDSVGYAGRLLFADIPVVRTLGQEKVSRPRGGMPKPDHRTFYFTPRDTILGRKFYYHQQDYQQVAKIYANQRGMPTITVQAIPAGTMLTGATIHFFNLSDQELASLVYAMVLEDHLAHKLGYAKPLGLGSVRIRITRLDIEPLVNHVPARFFSYGEPTLEDRTAQVGTWRDDAKRAWLARSNGRESYEAFTTIALWPQQENFVYPSFDFFRTERGESPKTTLWAYQGRKSFHPQAVVIPPTLPTKPATPSPTLSISEYELRRLVVGLKHAGKSVYIGIVVIADAELQEQVQQRVDQAIAPELRSSTIDLQSFALSGKAEISSDPANVTHLVGMDKIHILDNRLVVWGSLNRAREYLGHTGGPVLIWVTPPLLREFALNAADLYSWHSGVYKLIPQRHVGQLVRQGTGYGVRDDETNQIYPKVGDISSKLKKNITADGTLPRVSFLIEWQNVGGKACEVARDLRLEGEG